MQCDMRLKMKRTIDCNKPCIQEVEDRMLSATCKGAQALVYFWS